MTQAGLLTCARYAFAPNRLQYCGPMKSAEIQSYLKESQTDEKLSEVLSAFETMYPYLQYIADANNIENPYDKRVVDAYWVGNNLLNTPSQKSMYSHFMEKLQLNKRVSPNELKWILSKIPQGALAHHTFHVLNIFTRTGHHTVKHTIETMDSCRIGWGKLKFVNNDSVWLFTKSLVIYNGKLTLGPLQLKKIDIPSWMRVSTADIGCVFTYHWSSLCEKINFRKAYFLEKVTSSAIHLANLTI